jgi:hypothetical protein
MPNFRSVRSGWRSRLRNPIRSGKEDSRRLFDALFSTPTDTLDGKRVAAVLAAACPRRPENQPPPRLAGDKHAVARAMRLLQREVLKLAARVASGESIVLQCCCADEWSHLHVVAARIRALAAGQPLPPPPNAARQPRNPHHPRCSACCGCESRASAARPPKEACERLLEESL